MERPAQLGLLIRATSLLLEKTGSLEFSTGKYERLLTDLISNIVRQGQPLLEFPSNQTPRIEDMAWDKDNDSLAILTATNVISIWSMGLNKF